MSNETFNDLLYYIKTGGHDMAMNILKTPGIEKVVPMDGMSALHHSACCGNLEICKELISLGADVNLINRYGETPLDISSTEEISELLIKNGGRKNRFL